jgi:hypothetical protein
LFDRAAAADLLSSVVVGADAPCLDVSLRREGQVQRWAIHGRGEGWTCLRATPGQCMATACDSRDEIEAKMREWVAEIAVARRAGWA